MTRLHFWGNFHEFYLKKLIFEMNFCLFCLVCFVWSVWFVCCLICLVCLVCFVCSNSKQQTTNNNQRNKQTRVVFLLVPIFASHEVHFMCGHYVRSVIFILCEIYWGYVPTKSQRPRVAAAHEMHFM